MIRYSLKIFSLCLLLNSCNYTYTVRVYTPSEDYTIYLEDKRDTQFQICYHEGNYYFSPVHSDGWHKEAHCCRGATWYEVLHTRKNRNKIVLD